MIINRGKAYNLSPFKILTPQKKLRILVFGYTACHFPQPDAVLLVPVIEFYKSIYMSLIQF